MMDQLGIKALRPGPSGNEKVANHANYDEGKANPFADIPDPLTMNNGQKVTTVKMWWDERRPEIVEMFEKYVYGRVPPNVPKVTWTITALRDMNSSLLIKLRLSRPRSWYGSISAPCSRVPGSGIRVT